MLVGLYWVGKIDVGLGSTNLDHARSGSPPVQGIVVVASVRVRPPILGAVGPVNAAASSWAGSSAISSTWGRGLDP